MVAGAQARPADVARIRQQMGLDDPLPVRYAHFWTRLVHLGPRVVGPAAGSAHATCAAVIPLGSRAVHLDFGKSFQKQQAVVDLLAQRLPRTLLLAAAGLLLQLGLGIFTGVVAASRRDSWVDRLLVSSTLLGISVPTFLIALTLQITFARGLGWLPIDGFGVTWGQHLRCLVLPALTLGIYGAAFYTRLVRDEMLVLLKQDWVRTARAKGLSPSSVIVRHGLRNALVPIVTAAGLDLGALLGGAVVTETVFRWPGLGDLGVHALLDRDGPIILACVVVSSFVVVASNVGVDALYARLDPRMR
jgi:peptide/nickel transport system permease protein